MGNDGGSIQNRSELVKKKEIDRTKKDVDDLEDYYICAISRQDLEKPIVSCQLGRLYNRNALIQYMIDRKEGKTNLTDVAAHVKSLKQVSEISIENPRTYVCPLTNKRFGRGVFIYLNCGCVYSKQVIQKCPRCNIEVTKSTILNPIKEDLLKMVARLQKKKKKTSKKDNRLLKL